MRAVREQDVAGREGLTHRSPHASLEGRRAALLALQRTAGNGAVAALLRPPMVQRACSCGTCGGCGDKSSEQDQDAPVQREDEQPAEPTVGAQGAITATPRVEACAGSSATGGTGAGVGIGGEELGPTAGDDEQTGPSSGVAPPGEIEDPLNPLEEPAAAAGTATCKTLSWSDFPESDKGGAFTSYVYKMSGNTFTAEFDSASSYRAKNVEKVFDGHLSDCNSTDFEKFSFEIDGKPEATCTATKQPGPATATKKAECASKIKPLVEVANAAESARLLRHEQYHMKMGCTLATKGTAALADGKKVTTATLTNKNSALSTSYDSKAQTDHSCNQGSQTKWEADIDAGLPGVTF